MHATRRSTDWALRANRQCATSAGLQDAGSDPRQRHRSAIDHECFSSRPTTIPMTYHHAVLLLCLRAETRSMTMLWRTRSVCGVQTLNGTLRG